MDNKLIIKYAGKQLELSYKGKLYVISDTHFNHKNIIKYCNRPFADVDTMNKQLIENWNAIVTDDDIVIHLGDVCFGLPDLWEGFVSQLKGRKILVLGNHDRIRRATRGPFWINCGFDFVLDGPIVVDDLILSHEPVEDIGDCVLNVHGHLHDKTKNIDKYASACVENIGYTPVELSKIRHWYKIIK